MTLKLLTFATVAVIGVHASTPIDMGCLSNTDAFGKYADDDPSMQAYRRSNFVETNVLSPMRISGITACQGNAGHLKGF